MPVAILDPDAECPDCDHRGAWAQTVAQAPTVEAFRCEECAAEWRTMR